MEEEILKYRTHIDEKVNEKCDVISDYIYNFDRHSYDNYRDNSVILTDVKFYKYLELKLGKKEMNNLFNEILRDVIHNRVDINEIFERINSIKNVYNNKEEDSISARKWLIDNNVSLNELDYLYLVNHISSAYKFFIDHPKECEVVTKAHKELNYYISVYNVFSKENKILLECSYKDFVFELNNYSNKYKELYDLFNEFIKRSVNTKNNLGKDIFSLEFDNIYITSEDALKHYEELYELLDELNITSLDNLDIDELIYVLERFGFRNDVINGITTYLTNEESTNSINVNINIDSGLDEYEKKSELNKKLREILSEYFDLKDMHLKRFLSRKETNLVLSILRELSYPESTIRDFIWTNETMLSDEMLIVKCNYIKDKAEFYSSKYGFEREFSDFLEYYNGYFESKTKEDKELYLEFLEVSYNDIKSIMNLVPRTYEYELSMSNKKLNLILKKD